MFKKEIIDRCMHIYESLKGTCGFSIYLYVEFVSVIFFFNHICTPYISLL